MRSLRQGFQQPEIPHLVDWQANRSGSGITIIGTIDGKAKKVHADTIRGGGWDGLVAYRDATLVATLAASIEAKAVV